MDKRIIRFWLVSLVVLVGWASLRSLVVPPQPPEVPQADAMNGQAVPAEATDQKSSPSGVLANDGKAKDKDATKESDSMALSPPGDAGPDRSAAKATSQDPAAEPALPVEAISTDRPRQLVALGSVDPASPYRLAVVFDTRGGSVRRVELSDARFTDVDDTGGYLGHLELADVPTGGCRVHVVVPGTPAARAESGGPSSSVGLQGPSLVADGQGYLSLSPDRSGDVIVAVGTQPIANTAEFEYWLKQRRPGEKIELTVERSVPGQPAPQRLTFRTTLGRRPVEVVHPHPAMPGVPATADQGSYGVELTKVGDTSLAFGEQTLPGLNSMQDLQWAVRSLDDSAAPGVEFHLLLSEKQLEQVGQSGPIELIKRYRLVPVPESEREDLSYRAYHLTMEVELRNLAPKPTQLAYQLYGPTGTLLEGWWYSTKVHPRKFSGAGLRDVAYRVDDKSHQLMACGEIVKNAVKTDKAARTANPDTILAANPPAVRLHYAGVDSQYFAAMMLTDGGETAASPDSAGLEIDRLEAKVVGSPDTERDTKTDVTFRMTSKTVAIPAGESHRDRYALFFGPKDDAILTQYGLSELIVYGWFGPVVKVLLTILHAFHAVVRNWGIAIVLLTLLVRGCLFPLSRKMAQNAQIMQELAPEMKRIAEKYGNDMEKRTAAQRELFAKHNYNPFGGCLLMFLQLPIFIGLYRGLSVDIALRQAPLIPGLSWCSNLAGPDKFWEWQQWMPAILAGETGWLGPYLNLLPLITVALFLVHQKLFTPPATDDQQRMQQQMMNFMMLFMGVMFHKVASGLCIYFITSSLWGVAERVMQGKRKQSTAVAAAVPVPVARPQRSKRRN